MVEKFDLIDYEVWGNEADGWEVNDLFRIQRGLEFDEVTEETVLEKLKEVGYLKEFVTLDMVEIEIEEFNIIINQREDFKPLCELRKSDL